MNEYWRTPYATGLERPLLRGVSHAVASLAIAVYGTWLATTCRVPAIAAIFTAGMWCCYTASAVYHIGNWSPKVEKLLQRTDHAMIFVITAGSYTPAALLIGRPDFIHIVTTVCVIGVLYSYIKPDRAEQDAFGLVLNVLAGGTLLPYIWLIYNAVPHWGFACLLACIILYATSVVIYVKKWPDPWPSVFGYHEIMHIMVVASGAATASLNTWIVYQL